MNKQEKLKTIYDAFDEKTGRFRNFMTYDRQWPEKIGREECNGRALVALGPAVDDPPNETILNLVTREVCVCAELLISFHKLNKPDGINRILQPISINLFRLGINAYKNNSKNTNPS